MPRNPSKILSATEAKELDLGQKIAEATKEHAKSEKLFKKTLGVLEKLLARQAKAEEKRLAKAPSEQ